MPTLDYKWEQKKEKINVIYRYCDVRDRTYMTNVSKSRCYENFLQVFGSGNVSIIADNCTPERLDILRRLPCIETNLGNSQSFAKTLDMALELDDNDIVYLLEDDYLHTAQAPKLIQEGLGIADFVSLYDHPDKYGYNTPNPLVQHGGELTRVLLTDSSHWKETNSTTMTFACRVRTLKKYHSKMRGYLDSSVPKDYLMWRDILQDARLITPMPGCSTHCHEPWITPFFEDIE